MKTVPLWVVWFLICTNIAQSLTLVWLVLKVVSWQYQ